MEQREELRLADYGLALRRWWHTVLACALVLAAVGAWAAMRSSGNYSSKVEISLVRDVHLGDDSSTPAEPTAAQVVAQLESRLPRYTERLDTIITVVASPDTDIVRVVGVGSNRDIVEQDAVAVARRFVDERREERRDDSTAARDYHLSRIEPLEQRVAELNGQLEQIASAGGETISLQTQLIESLETLTNHQEEAAKDEFLSAHANGGLDDPVAVSTEAVGASVLPGVIVGAMAGALLGVIIVVIRAHLDRRLRTARQVRRVTPDAAIVEVVQAQPRSTDLIPLAYGLLRRATALRVTVVEVAGIDASSTEVTPAFVALLKDSLDIAGGDHDHAPPVVVNARHEILTPPSDVRQGDRVDTVLLACSGKGTEHDLARAAAELRLAGTAIIAVVLYGVPRRELSWAFEDVFLAPMPVQSVPSNGASDRHTVGDAAATSRST